MYDSGSSLILGSNYESVVDFELNHLETAWRKTKYDIEQNHFLDEPVVLELIERNLDEYLSDLQNELSEGDYNPSRSTVIDAPKGGWRVRPATWLEIKDAVVFTALVLDIFEDVDSQLEETSGDVRFSHKLNDNFSEEVEWFESRMNTWSEFKQKSLSKAGEENIEQVVETDISGYYENVGIDRLMYDLRSMSSWDRGDKHDLLEECLKKWAKPRDRGIPQGYSSSDILAEIYLHNFDKKLKGRGIRHARFNDDVRLFCENKEDAIKSLQLVTNLFRSKGLNLNSGKTSIMKAEEAVKRFSRSSEKIEDLKEEIQDELPEETVDIDPGPYSTPSDIQRMKQRVENLRDDEELEMEALDRAFENDIQSKGSSFDSSLFHYVLNRMASLKKPEALHFCINIMPSRPEETDYIIIRYFSELEASAKAEARDRLAKKIIDGDFHYEYQVFHILKWYFEEGISSEYSLEAAREILFNRAYGDVSRHLEDYCISYLAEYGDMADLEEIVSIYEGTRSDVKEATIVEAFREMETIRREEIYERANSDSFLVAKAIENVE